jgi:Leucine-rich repeat (LRR) protein
MTTLNCLDEVYGLKHLEISNTSVTDLSPLAAHPELESVTVSRDMEPAVAALGDNVPFQITYE